MSLTNAFLFQAYQIMDVLAMKTSARITAWTKVGNMVSALAKGTQTAFAVFCRNRRQK